MVGNRVLLNPLPILNSPCLLEKQWGFVKVIRFPMHSTTDLAIKIAKVLEAHGSGPAPISGETVKTASRNAQGGDSPQSSSAFPMLHVPDLGNPVAYIQFLLGLLNFASGPGAARPVLATNYNCGTPQGARS